MSIKEYQRLRGYVKAKSYSPWKSVGASYSGRRSVKNKAKAVGQILKNSRIQSMSLH